MVSISYRVTYEKLVPHLEIGNNAAERYLFAGSDAGGERAAVIYSLIGTTKLKGLDPEAYLREVLTHRRSSHQPHRGVTALEYRRKLNRSIDHRIVANNSGLVSSYLPNVADLISYGHITVGVFHPTGCIAIASDGDRTLAMLLRRPDETIAQLLTRLDQAINKAVVEDICTDEINSPARHL